MSWQPLSLPTLCQTTCPLQLGFPQPTIDQNLGSWLSGSGAGALVVKGGVSSRTPKIGKATTHGAATTVWAMASAESVLRNCILLGDLIDVLRKMDLKRR
jgi:hypothetical protein